MSSPVSLGTSKTDKSIVALLPTTPWHETHVTQCISELEKEKEKVNTMKHDHELTH